MSSSDEDYGDDLHRKRRRVQRACDFCRRRRSKCDGSQMAGGKCTTCLEAKIDCTYVQNPVKRPSKSYVDSLEAQLERSEDLVRQLRSELMNIHLAKTSNIPWAQSSSQFSSEAAQKNITSEQASQTHPDGWDAYLYIMRMTLRSLSAPPPPTHADDLVHLEIAEKFGKIALATVKEHPFMGKSSGAALVKAAIELKADVKREELEEAISHSPNQSSFDNRISGNSGEQDTGAWTSRRMQYWTWKPWENTALRICTFTFPDEPLLGQLIDLYFTRQNIYLPLLHRPTFERGVAEGLHLRDKGFAMTVLLVCAIGSRWSMHPSVVEKGLSCGWEWFDQASNAGPHLLGRAALYDLQHYCLAVQFLNGSSGPQACWTLIGVGLRLAQDLGIHRRQAPNEGPSVERELYKRTFWVLVCLDRIISAGLGRCCALQFEDFDTEPLLEVDDEYWEHPTHPFQQPVGVPSRIAYFNTLMRLNHILGFSLKTLYSLNKIHAFFPLYESWEEQVVPELDSALNSWHEQIPEHLRWDPMRQDPVFFDQSVALHCWYYHLQILIHRPFIPMLRKPTAMALPSLAICTSAARACANMADMQRRRNGGVPVVFNLHTIFISGLVLLLNVWSGKRTGLGPDPSREMACVQKCMGIVRLCEGRWQNAGIMWDILAELASVGQLPLPNPRLSHNAVAGTEDQQSKSDAPIPTLQYPTYDLPVQEPYAPAVKPSFTGGGNGALGPSAFERMEPSAFAATPASDSRTWFPPDMNTNPAQTNYDQRGVIDSDTIAMWTNAPMGLEIADWGMYLSNFNEITQTQVDTGLNGHFSPPTR
ncbi:Zn(2)-C6 fungal-type domain-containing protein [Mycena venus]|uniref:Zn(2)-C6 fungal-type domain-containing protein n=1 Tax=Mycena venus TaxID=2733690 RepID=A0A8H6X7V8_9AGAR|nr:Zn(2)-C6 fungal-type domain-containing protein [Mycena venus]